MKFRVVGSLLFAVVAAVVGSHQGAQGAHVAGCAAVAAAPDYYAFPLVGTKKVPGTYGATGRAEVSFTPSPFAVSLAPDGSYRYDLHLSVEGLGRPGPGVFTAWVTTRELDRIERIGVFGESLTVEGTVAWNKFLVVVTLEEQDDPTAATWRGPIVLRGMSRSGMMHTMAGHGPFEIENCQTYGYGSDN